MTPPKSSSPRLVITATARTKVKFCDYKKAEKLLADDDYDAAKAIFSTLGSYENSADQVKECDYEKADALFQR